MRLLLVLDDTQQRLACADYFAQSGCDVDETPDPLLAETLISFHDYDAVLSDSEDDRVLPAACRRNPAVLPVLLTTAEHPGVAGSVIALTKPFSLSVVLELTRNRLRTRT